MDDNRYTKNTQLQSESIMVRTGDGTHQLHMKRLYTSIGVVGTPVFMLHGLVEDGRIFYSAEGFGLAWYLASLGYDVYVPDFRGKGKSWPALDTESEDGLHEAINQDIPALLKAIVRKRGPIPQIWVSHAWGGVLGSSYYARYGDRAAPVQAMVYFGSRRCVSADGWRKNLALKGVWKNALMMASRLSGYVPAEKLHLGTSNESRAYFGDVLSWMFDSAWIDRVDSFDYSVAAKLRMFPPSLYFASEADTVYGNPDDVREFIQDLGEHRGRLVLLSKRAGSQRDYGHIDMLSGMDAESDHFPVLVQWLAGHRPERTAVPAAEELNVPTLERVLA